MGLFVKKTASNNRPTYTLSLSNTKLLVGLGNIGKEYDGTRHNIGFVVVDAFVAKNDAVWREHKDLKCHFADVRNGSTRVIIIKPTTFMNLSGESVLAVQQFYKIKGTDTLVVHDELDIPFGQLRTRFAGSSAGHNGIKSLIDLTSENFNRLRIGVLGDKPVKMDTADYVLGKFSNEEREILPIITKESQNIINEWLASDAAVSPNTIDLR